MKPPFPRALPSAASQVCIARKLIWKWKGQGLEPGTLTLDARALSGAFSPWLLLPPVLCINVAQPGAELQVQEVQEQRLQHQGSHLSCHGGWWWWEQVLEGVAPTPHRRQGQVHAFL